VVKEDHIPEDSNTQEEAPKVVTVMVSNNLIKAKVATQDERMTSPGPRHETGGQSCWTCFRDTQSGVSLINHLVSALVCPKKPWSSFPYKEMSKCNVFFCVVAFEGASLYLYTQWRRRVFSRVPDRLEPTGMFPSSIVVRRVDIKEPPHHILSHQHCALSYLATP